LEYLLLLARDLGYFQENIYQSMQNELVEIRKMLNVFIQKLKANRYLPNAKGDNLRTELLLTVGIIGFVLLILNAIFLGIIFFMRRKMAAVSQWPSTMGTVMMSTIEQRSSSEGGYTDYPVVQYSYQVGGQAYQSYKLAPGPGWADQAQGK
jgi:hypothetical protein